jgi:hypothetical protein
MQLVRRIVAALTALIAAVLYIWFAAVRHAPEVRRKKAIRRR